MNLLWARPEDFLNSSGRQQAVNVGRPFMTDITFISLEIKIEKEQLVTVLMHEDGTINRRGDATGRKDMPFAMGLANTKLIFEQLEPAISSCSEYFNQSFDDTDKKGKVITLELNFTKKAQRSGFIFTYGSDSMSPPRPVADLVSKILELTTDFYSQAIANVKKEHKKKWWQF